MWNESSDLSNTSPTAAVRTALARFANETGPRVEANRANDDAYWQLVALAYFAARLSKAAQRARARSQDLVPPNVERALKNFLGEHGLDRITGGQQVEAGWDDTPPDIIEWTTRILTPGATE